MSDTPITDEFILHCVRTDYNWRILARHLENQLNAANTEIKSMQSDISLALIMIEKMKTTIRK